MFLMAASGAGKSTPRPDIGGQARPGVRTHVVDPTAAEPAPWRDVAAGALADAVDAVPLEFARPARPDGARLSGRQSSTVPSARTSHTQLEATAAGGHP